jgi:hypothetical protein
MLSVCNADLSDHVHRRQAFFWQPVIRSVIPPAMSKREDNDWLRDIDSRQRNEVFPDTVQNEGRLWRNLWSGRSPLNIAQWAGVVVLFLFFGGSVLFILRLLWPEGHGSWWKKTIDAYGIYVVAIGAVVTFIAIGNWRSRRDGPKH